MINQKKCLGDGIPIITTAGMVTHFDDKKGEFKLLTRMSGDYTPLGWLSLIILQQISTIQTNDLNLSHKQMLL